MLVSRIALVSPDRARQIEAILLRMAQSGQLRGRVTEEQLIDLLEKASIIANGLVVPDLSRALIFQADDAQGRSQPKKGTIVVCPAYYQHLLANILNDVNTGSSSAARVGLTTMTIFELCRRK
jgi:hypothetical protein